MIDVVTVIHKNYSLLPLQLEAWRRTCEPFRLLVCDNTPVEERLTLPETENLTVWVADPHGIDGESHGSALDFLCSKVESDIVAVVDSDFFWLQKDIVSEVREMFQNGARCVGCAGFYRDWQRVIDVQHPDRAGHLAPVCWGMFGAPDLLRSETFVCSAQEAAQSRETGWRLRKKIIEERIPSVVFPGFYLEHGDPEVVYFGEDKENPRGVHFMKGSGFRIWESHGIPEILGW